MEFFNDLHPADMDRTSSIFTAGKYAGENHGSANLTTLMDSLQLHNLKSLGVALGSPPQSLDGDAQDDNERCKRRCFTRFFATAKA
jgi:hypothetical protein